MKVLFYTLPLSISYEEIQKHLTDHPALDEAIKYYVDRLLLEKQIETFKIDRNLAITEVGYMLAIPEEWTKEKPTPV
jgi:hypothetical protein